MTTNAYLNSLSLVARALRDGELELLAYLDVLEEQFQNREPLVRALLPEAGRFRRLRKDAEKLLQRYPRPAGRPPLFGVAAGIKDIFNVDGFATRAGSALPAEEFTGPEAECVTRLKHAGALVLGKTISAEFAYFAPGETRNPIDPDRTPGGSSSGSAAAVGAHMCPLALGTQTIGSINRPAAYCGVIGFKPSYERISRMGVLPVSESLDHVGFFVSDVPSARLAAAVMIPGWREQTSDRRPVLGVPMGPYLDRADPQGLDNLEQTCNRLAGAGYRIVKPSVMADFEEIAGRHLNIMSTEMAQVHAQWYARYASLYHEKSEALIRQGMATPDTDYKRALPGRKRLRRQLETAMADAGVDLWIAPAARGVAPLGLDSTGDPIMSLPWTHSGLPALNVPSGTDENGLPFGAQLVGRWYGDEQLLAWAVDIEKIVAGGQ